ncbi:MAG: HD domain-containing protein [Smithellaceae bacterium]|jgi:hypothetical protein
MNRDLHFFLTEWFDQYVNRYRDAEGLLPAALELKYTHSKRVAENARLIAGGLELADDVVLLTEVCGLMHDLGRFTQYTCYGSFSDAVTVDHGREGRRILETEGLPEMLGAGDWPQMACSVEYHNRKVSDIPAGIPAETECLLKLIRDADKLDIMDLVLKSVRRDGFRELPDMLPHISTSRELTAAVIDEVMKTKTVSTGSLATVTDFLIMLASWFYDLNYAVTRRLAVSRSIIERLKQELPDTPAVRTLLNDIRKMEN